MRSNTFQPKVRRQMKRYSWTTILDFLKCMRYGELKHIEGYRERPSVSSRPMILGSAVHKGIETALRMRTELTGDPRANVGRAVTMGVNAARQYVRDETRMDVLKYESGRSVPDTAYYQMMDELTGLAPTLARYHVGQLPQTWRVAYKWEVLGRMTEGTEQSVTGIEYDQDTLALEWNISHITPDGDLLTGIVDCIVIDTATGELFIVDWKVRTSFPRSEEAFVDGQLHLYAAMLNAAGASIRKVVMYQMKNKTPSPAEILKSGEPGTGRASYDTTWDVWAMDVRAVGKDPEKYRAEIEPKLKRDDEFRSIVSSAVTENSSTLSLENAYAAIKQVKEAEKTEQFPAILSSYACSNCAFLKLCAGPFRFGGDATVILDRDFDKKKEAV